VPHLNPRPSQSDIAVMYACTETRLFIEPEKKIAKVLKTDPTVYLGCSASSAESPDLSLSFSSAAVSLPALQNSPDKPQ